MSIISTLGIIVYSNTFLVPFQFDDYPSIINNDAIKNIHYLSDIWNYVPCRFISFFSLALNYSFSQLDVVTYHLFNLSVHLLSAILVWWFTLLTLSTPVMKDSKIASHANLIALLAGLVFVAHPIQTQAVTYIVQRCASMAAMFYLASLCFYVQSRFLEGEKLGSGRMYYVGSLIAAVAAMFTKETAITLPLMILLYEFSFLRTKRSFNWKPQIPFFLTIFIIPLTMLLVGSVKARVMPGLEAGGLLASWQYLLTQFKVIVTYIRLVFLPFNQNIDYDLAISKSIFEWPVLLSCVFLIIILFAAQRLFSSYRLVSFSIGLFFLTLLPESSLLPLKDPIVEHRLYLPLAGYSLFLVSSIFYLLEKNGLKTVIIVLVMIISCYSVMTYQRNKIWKDSVTLWDDTVKKSSHKARAYNNLGEAYYQQGSFANGIVNQNKAIAINPYYAKAYFDRGNAYLQLGKINQAILDFNKTILINPGFAEAYNNRGVSYAMIGNNTQAMADFNKAIELNPKNKEIYRNRAITP